MEQTGRKRPRFWLTPVHPELIPGDLAAFQNSPPSSQQAYFDGCSPKVGYFISSCTGLEDLGFIESMFFSIFPTCAFLPKAAK